MRNVLHAVLFLALSAAPPALAQQPPAPAAPNAPVPVKRIILYSSGVGYFQHAGIVTGDATTDLQFDTGQINDVLKSLVLEDKGGSVTSVTYASENPLARTLKSFHVDITANPSLEQLLNQLRGEHVTATLPSEQITGTILGVQTRTKPSGPDKTYDVPVLNLVDGASIRSIEIPDIRDIKLDDPVLQGELAKALAAVAGARDQDKKTMTVHFHGQGDHQVLMGYVVETPIWKTSYRLVLQNLAAAADNNATQPSGTNFQGWAIVENQTDNDWNDVELSLMSGRPISFIQDLYQPLYIPRMLVQPQLYSSLTPQTYDLGMNTREDVVGPGQQGRGAGGGGGGGGFGAGITANRARQMQAFNQNAGNNSDFAANTAAPMTPPQAELNPMDSIASIASAAQIGELFQYTIPTVSIPRQSSAMLPIVTDSLAVQKLSIYNASVLPRNPLNGARLKNTTGKHLLGGPITVLDGDTYAGDAQIADMTPNQVRFISYGIDQEMLIDTTHPDSTDDLVTGKIVKGVLTETHRQAMTSVYDIKNNSDHEKTLIIEHPITEGWSLYDTPDPAEKTDRVYRFEQKIKAGDKSQFSVKEQIVLSQDLAILDGDMDRVIALSQRGEIPKDVRDALQKATDLRRAVEDVKAKLATDVTSEAAIVTDQKRIDENLRTVDRQSTVYSRLLTKLNDQETQLEKIRADEDDLKKQQADRQKDLEDYLTNLNVG